MRNEEGRRKKEESLDYSSFFNSHYSLILLVLIFSLIYVSQVVGASYTKENVSIVALIDNSGSMDFAGHDEEGLRFQAAKMLIDKCKVGDKLAFIDFSGKSVLLQPFTRITPQDGSRRALSGDKKQKEYLKRKISSIKSDRQLTNIDAALQMALREFSKEKGNANKKSVVLLTDGEIDTVIGSKEEKQRAAQMSEISIMNNTVHGYLQSDIAIYVVALTEKSDQDFLEELADTAKSQQQAEEKHYFFSPSNAQLVDIFSQIINQMRGLAVSTNTYQVNGEVVQNIPLIDPFAEEAEFQFTFEKGKKVNVNLRDPGGKTVQPTAIEDTYQLYSIEHPEQGMWKATVNSNENAMVTQTVAVAEEINIATPFSSKFHEGIPWPIIANIKYKGRVMEANQFNVDIDGREGIFSINKLTVQIQHPDGKQKGAYKLQNHYGDYAFTYKSANTPGLYVLRFELKGNVSGKDVTVKTEKRVTVVADTVTPQLTFRKLKESYSVDEPVNLEIEVTKNGDSMHMLTIDVGVTSPNGTSTIKIPRKGRRLYGLAYEQTNAKGEYTFTIAESKDYGIKEPTQKVTILSSKNTSPIMFIGFALGAVLLGCGITTPILLKRGVFQKLIKPKARKADTVIEAIENIQNDISQEVPEEMEATDSEPDEEESADDKEIIPNEPNVVEVVLLDETPSHFPDKIVCHAKDGVVKLSFQKKEDVIFGGHFFRAAVEIGQISVNGKIVCAGEEAKIVNNDTIKIGELSLKVSAKEDNVQLMPDDTEQELPNVEEEIDEDGLIRWNIK